MIVNARQQQLVKIADRGFQYGDGCFTTMAFRNGRIEFFDAHIERLKWACKTLYINFTKWSELDSCIRDSLTSSSDCVVKVMITRGEGGRGYSPEGAVNPCFIITHHCIPSHYTCWQTQGISLAISPITLACQPLLAGIKHLNRLEQVLVKQELSKTHYDDVVVCDTQHNIIESSVGNLFWYKDNAFYTADLSGSGVEGVMRNQIIRVIQQNRQLCHVVQQDVSVLFSAHEVFICNSLMKLVPVVSLFNPVNQQHKYYPVDQTKQLQHHIQQLINLEAIKV